MQWRTFFKRTSALGAAMAVLLVLSCVSGGRPPANVKNVECTGAKIQWQVAPEAEVTGFACSFGTHEGDPSLIFTIGLKNIGTEGARFRLAVFLLDMDKAVAYLVPIKGSPPQVAVGEEVSIKIPFMKTTEMAEEIMVRVTTMSND